MIETARLELDVTDLHRSEHGSVTAKIWLCVEDFAFPEEGWRDFAVPMLSWWSDAAVRILQLTSQADRVRFMDGPYIVEVEPTSSGAWRLALIEDYENRRVRRTAVVDAGLLVDSILVASETMLTVYRAHGWDDESSARLTASMARLREARKPK